MYEGAVGIGEHLVAVQVLEVFIETVFTGALERVAHESRRPAEEDASDSFLGEDCAPCGEVGGVDLGIDLAPAFNEVEGRYSRVGRSWGRSLGWWKYSICGGMLTACFIIRDEG